MSFNSLVTKQDFGGSLDVALKQQVGWITFGHPSHNSLPSELLNRMALALMKFGSDPEVKIIVMQSSGDRTFCAGANFQEMVTLKGSEDAEKFFSGFADVINAIRTCKKLVIGRLQGKAVGGGVGLAAAVDYCMATKWSSIKLSELSIGLAPLVIGPAVERKIGLAAFSELALNSNEWRTADWAKQKGLFQEVFDTSELMDNYLHRFLEQFRGYGDQSLEALKTIFWEKTADWTDLLKMRAHESGKLLLQPNTQREIEKLLALEEGS